MDETARGELFRRWLHSHEEDTPTHQVFRPATHDLPPSRGRFGFEPRPDGSVVFHGIGPADRSRPAAGAWTHEGGRLTLHTAPGSAADEVLEIDSVMADRLLVRK